MAMPESEHGIGARGIGFKGAAEGVGGFLPLLEIAQAHAAIEVRGAMQRLQLRELCVGARGGLVVAHFILDMAQGGVERRLFFAVFHGFVEKAGGRFELAFEVEGNGLGERLVGALLDLEIVDRGHARRHGDPVAFVSGYVFH
jgi:hypothetical protein